MNVSENLYLKTCRSGNFQSPRSPTVLELDSLLSSLCVISQSKSSHPWPVLVATVPICGCKVDVCIFSGNMLRAFLLDVAHVCI
jgi:hypothetical protein